MRDSVLRIAVINDKESKMDRIEKKHNFIGKLSSYNKDDDFEDYLTLAEIFFELNDIVDDDLKVKMMLIHMGEKSAFELMKAIRPKKFNHFTFEELMKEARKVFIPEKDEIMATFNLLRRRQKTNETYRQYANTLRKMATDCNYKECCKEKILRDLFITGITASEEAISEILYARPKDLSEALKLMEIYEAAANVKHMKITEKNSDDGGENVTRGKQLQNRSKEKEKQLKKNIKCHNCNQYGHRANVCPTKSDSDGSFLYGAISYGET